MIKIVIPVVPVAQGRPRLGHGHAYDPQKSRDYKNIVRLMAADQLRGKPPLQGAIILTVKIYRPIPKQFTKAKRAAAIAGTLRPITKPDLDNYVKGVKDALNGIVWHDDSQVVEYGAGSGKWYSDDPRVEVCVVVI